jgi:SAM-dependent methyltransferase
VSAGRGGIMSGVLCVYPGGSLSSKAAYPDHRQFVGPPEKYDLASASQFNLLTLLGLREHHFLLDIGCGSLRAGRLLISYLLPGRYFGIEPEQWLIDQAIENEVGRDLVRIKTPTFSNDVDFTMTTFGRRFDYMVAQSVFSHATQAQIRRCFSQVRQALEPDGVFAATFFEGDSDYEGDEWVYPGRVHYTMGHFQAMAVEHGLRCRRVNWTHTNEQTWVTLVHEDRAVDLPEIADAARVSVLEHNLAEMRQKVAEVQSMAGFKVLRKLNRLMGRRVPKG